MRKLLLTAAIGLLGFTGTVNAQSLTTSGPGGSKPPSVAAPCALGVGSITQSADCANAGGGVMCASDATGATTDTSHLRRFFLTADEGIVSNYNVTSVDFGVEVDEPDTVDGNPVTVNIYSIPTGAPFTFANMTQLDSTLIDLNGTNAGSIVNVAVSGTVNPATDDLVVEIFSFDHQASNDIGRFFIGANALGQTRPSYIAAADCGLTEPTDLASIGFPDSHDVMVVNGFEDQACMANIRAEVQSRDGKQRIRYGARITHNKADVNVPIYVELRDTAGNVLAVKDHGLTMLAQGQTVDLKGTINVHGLASGHYLVVAKIERMSGFREIKKLIYID